MSSIKRIKEQKIKKIVIVGGSHSGFSSAWMLLNGPADLWHNTSINNSQKKDHKEGEAYNFPGAVYKSTDACTRCCNCKGGSKTPSKMSKKASDSGAESKKDACKCICKCFGFFKYKHWNFDY